MSSQIVDIRPAQAVQEYPDVPQDTDEKKIDPPERQDAFGDEEHAEVKYKVLKWRYDCFPPVAYFLTDQAMRPPHGRRDHFTGYPLVASRSGRTGAGPGGYNPHWDGNNSLVHGIRDRTVQSAIPSHNQHG